MTSWFFLRLAFRYGSEGGWTPLKKPEETHEAVDATELERNEPATGDDRVRRLREIQQEILGGRYKISSELLADRLLAKLKGKKD